MGGPVWESPLDWLSGGRGGVEFAFDFGLSVRAGLSSFTTFKSVTAGAGLTIAKFLKVDYAFESHPVFSPVHRVSLSVSPYLFAHAPKPEPEAARRGSAGSSLLGAEPDEPDEIAPEGAAQPAGQADGQQASQATGQPAGPAPEASAPQAPVVEESSDEVLEPAPSGGVYWEE